MTGVLKMPVSLACCPSINTELHRMRFSGSSAAPPLELQRVAVLCRPHLLRLVPASVVGLFGSRMPLWQG